MTRTTLLWLLAYVGLSAASYSLDCDFHSDCCWRGAEGEGEWSLRDSISANDFRRTFVVGRTVTPPAGPFVMRLQPKSDDGGSAFMSCPFCSRNQVVVRFRHWQSPSSRLSLCWQIVAAQQDSPLLGNSEECIVISSKAQNSFHKNTLSVPVGKQVQLYFLIENTGSAAPAVLIIDRIYVDYQDCSNRASILGLAPAENRTLQAHTSSSRKHSPQHVAPQLSHSSSKASASSAIEELARMKKINSELERRIRNLEASLGSTSSKSSSKAVIDTLGIHQSRSLARPPYSSHTSRLKKKINPIHVPNFQAATLAPMLGLDFNPLHDLLGKDFSDFLDPSFTTNSNDGADEDEEDAEETREYFRQQEIQKRQAAQRKGRRASPRALSAPSSPQITKPSEAGTYIGPSAEAMLRRQTSILRSPNSCDTPGGCLFERGFCTYKNLGKEPKFQLMRMGGSSFAYASVHPNSSAILETSTTLYKEHVIAVDVLENSNSIRLMGCCLVAGQPGMLCPYASPIEGSVSIWQSVTYKCPARTTKILFVCENGGTTTGECAVDNIRLHLPADILFWEPCQKDILADL